MAVFSRCWLVLFFCAVFNVAQGAESLRIEHDHESLVFATGEHWRLVITPEDSTLTEKVTARMRVRLVAVEGKDAIWQKEQPRRLAASKGLQPWELAVPIPEEEGVYHLDVTLVPDKSVIPDRFGIPGRLSNPFRPPDPIVARRIDLVVVGPHSLEVDSQATWREVIQFDPAQSRWWERLAKLPATVRWPGNSPRWLNNGLSATWQHRKQAIVRLEPGGWQAYALPVAQIGVPHVLEIDYPSDVSQTLGVSILQPGADGRIASAGIDTGFDVADSGVITPRTETYRLTYWPRVSHPYLLLVNRRDETPAVFGKIRVLAGPKRLSPVVSSPSTEPFRRPLAQFDSPAFFRTFGARRSSDPKTGQARDDWMTFYTGGVRLDEYLRHVGYAGAVVTFAAEGSVLYPSKVLPPAPESERGIVYGEGEDIARKDVAELLFRLFDRSGLKLVPKLHLSGILPQLEALVQDPEIGRGITLMSAEGQSWQTLEETEAFPLSHYNPLHPQVQAAMVQAVQEVVGRYGHHRSFGGIVIDVAPGTPTYLPGIDWGCDHQTLATFRQDVGSIEPVMDAAPSRWNPETQQAWIHWRAMRIAQLYRLMADQLHDVAPDASLMLDGAKLIDLPSLQRVTRPALPPRITFDQTMREFGIDSQLYQDQDRIVLLRMHRVESVTADAMQRAAMAQFNRASDVDLWATRGPLGTHSFYHPSQPIQMPSLDKVKLFGSQSGAARIKAQLPPAGDGNRARWTHSLAASDAMTVIDGGDVVPFGQEDTVRSLIDTMAKLPARPFATYGEPDETSPIVVRSLVRPDGMYLYVVNDSPWPVTAEIELAAPVDVRLHSVSRLQNLPPLTTRSPGEYVWPLEMGPYSLVAAHVSSPEAKITNVGTALPPQVATDMRERITRFQMRMAGLQQPHATRVPENRDFDTLATDGAIKGWEVTSVPGTRIQLDSLAHFNGVASLRMESQGPAASVRSSAFPAPSTGRISLHVQLRAHENRELPPLKLAIEGQYQGRTYYRSAPVNIDRAGQRDASQWSQFVLNVDDLPVGGLEQLRVRFDLLGPGVVWLDEVRVYHTWFSPREQRELSKIAALADFQLREGHYNQCREVLDGYWPHFLNQYITEPAKVARLSSRQSATATQRKNKRKPPPKDDPSVLQRMRHFMPKWPRIHRR